MTTSRSAKRWAVGLLVGLGSLLGFAAPAGAHASLLSTDPGNDSVVDAPPARVSMTFSEAVTALPGSVEVYGPDGERADSGTPASSRNGEQVDIGLDPDGKGTYTVSWRVTSDDGHTINGSWLFHVGERTGATAVANESGDRATEVLAWFARVLFTAGVVGVIGVGMLAGTRLVGAPATSAPTGPARRLWLVAAAVAVGGAALGLLAEVAQATGAGLLEAFGDVGEVVSGSRSGTLDAMRLLAVVVLLVLVTVVRHRFVVPVALAWAAAAVVVSSASGHAAVTAVPLASITIDSVHFLAAGVWLGGLAVVVSSAGDKLSIPRWSKMAGVAIGVVALTGVASAAFQLGAPRGLWETDYGQLLLAKVALVGVMGGLGWVNRRRLGELVDRAGIALRRVRAETVAGVAVLAVTGVLVSTVPATDALARPFSGSTQIGDVDATFTVAPARVGSNQVHIFFTDAGGPAEVDAAELSLSGPGVEPMRVPLTPITASHFTAVDASFGRPGTWTLDLVAVTDGEPAEGTISVPVR